MLKVRTLMVATGIIVSFVGFAGTIVLLSEWKIITFELAMLMLVALLGLYIGFGFLIAVYRLISRLD